MKKYIHLLLMAALATGVSLMGSDEAAARRAAGISHAVQYAPWSHYVGGPAGEQTEGPMQAMQPTHTATGDGSLDEGKDDYSKPTYGAQPPMPMMGMPFLVPAPRQYSEPILVPEPPVYCGDPRSDGMGEVENLGFGMAPMPPYSGSVQKAQQATRLVMQAVPVYAAAQPAQEPLGERMKERVSKWWSGKLMEDTPLEETPLDAYYYSKDSAQRRVYEAQVHNAKKAQEAALAELSEPLKAQLVDYDGSLLSHWRLLDLGYEPVQPSKGFKSWDYNQQKAGDVAAAARTLLDVENKEIQKQPDIFNVRGRQAFRILAPIFGAGATAAILADLFNKKKESKFLLFFEKLFKIKENKRISKKTWARWLTAALLMLGVDGVTSLMAWNKPYVARAASEIYGETGGTVWNSKAGKSYPERKFFPRWRRD